MTMKPDTLELRGLGRRKMEQFARKAERLAQSPEKYLKRLVEEDLAISQEARTRTFAQIMGPGKPLNEEEVDRLAERAKSRRCATMTRRR